MPVSQDSLVAGDVYVLDKGIDILQLNTKKSVGKERFKAAEFVQSIVSERHGPTEVTVYGQEPVPISFWTNILKKPWYTDPCYR